MGDKTYANCMSGGLPCFCSRSDKAPCPLSPRPWRHAPFPYVPYVPWHPQDAVFYEMLNSSAYIVTDPETADYFYLPIFIYWCGQGHSVLMGGGP